MKVRILVIGGVVTALIVGTLLVQPAVVPTATPAAVYPTPLNYWYGMTQIALTGTVAAEIRPTEQALGR